VEQQLLTLPELTVLKRPVTYNLFLSVLQIGVGRRSGTHAQYSLEKNVVIFGRMSASPLHAEEPTVIWSLTRWKKSPLPDKFAKHAANTFVTGCHNFNRSTLSAPE